jgi:predicted permease
VNLALTVLEIVSPVFILAAIGYGWVRLGFEYRVQFVTRLAMTLAIPCLIFVSLIKSDVDPASLATLSLASLMAYALIGLAAWMMVTALRLDRRSFLAPVIFGNTGNLGLPLALFAFGELGLSYAVVVFSMTAVLSFTIGVWLVSDKGSPWAVLKEPIVGATLIGALFLWQGWQPPRFLTNTLELIGQMAIPIMLLTLGVALARLTVRGLGFAALLSCAKLVICASLAWAVGRWFALEPTAFAVLVLQLATPVAVTSFLLAEKYGADADKVAGLVVVSTLLSVAALPMLLAVLL